MKIKNTGLMLLKTMMGSCEGGPSGPLADVLPQGKEEETVQPPKA